MEVHHPHHPSHKKKWSEYIIEFIMLFAAVTLGFFAENIREHQVLVERKNQNVEGIVQDLRKDSIQLVERISQYVIAMNNLEDQKFASFQYEKKQLSESNYLDFIIIVENKIMFSIPHPFTSINPCFPPKNTKPGPNLARIKQGL